MAAASSTLRSTHYSIIAAAYNIATNYLYEKLNYKKF